MNRPDTVAAWIGAIIIVLALFLGVFALQAWVFMLLWNWIVGGVFGGVTMTFWQSCGALFLLGMVAGFFKGTSKIK